MPEPVPDVEPEVEKDDDPLDLLPEVDLLLEVPLVEPEPEPLASEPEPGPLADPETEPLTEPELCEVEGRSW